MSAVWASAFAGEPVSEWEQGCPERREMQARLYGRTVLYNATSNYIDINGNGSCHVSFENIAIYLFKRLIYHQALIQDNGAENYAHAKSIYM